MIVVMRPTATKDEVDGVRRTVEENGLEAFISVGEERTVIGVVGSDLERVAHLGTLDGVEQVIRISSPYKLASSGAPGRADPGARQRGGARPRPGAGRHGRAVRRRVARAADGDGPMRQARGCPRPARRRLQAAHLALLVPGTRPARARAPAPGARRVRPAGHQRDRRPGTTCRPSTSTSTSSRSAPATWRTSSCSRRSARASARSSSSAA